MKGRHMLHHGKLEQLVQYPQCQQTWPLLSHACAGASIKMQEGEVLTQEEYYAVLVACYRVY